MAVKYKRRYGGYGPLKTKKGRGVKKYKNVNNYLNALYNNNKQYLDEHIKTFGDSRKKREIFKEEVMSRLGKINPYTGKKYTLKQAIDKVQRSTLITTKEERIALIREWIPIEDGLEDCSIDLWDMYRDYIDGKKEIAEINAEFQAGF